MARSIVLLGSLGGVSRVDFVQGLRPGTLDALVRRGLAVRRIRRHMHLCIELPFWTLSPAGETLRRELVENQ